MKTQLEKYLGSTQDTTTQKGDIHQVHELWHKKSRVESRQNYQTDEVILTIR
jgi:hypothetical protein